MSLSLQRFWCVPRRIARTLITANQYHSRIYLSTETPTDDINLEEDANDYSEQEAYSHYLSERPDSEFGRKMRIFMPARSAGTQGTAKVGMWKIEPVNPGKRWGNPLMGWTSTRDPMQSMNHGLDRFETKEHAVQWCESNGYEYEIMEPKLPKRKPKNYAATMGRNGIPRYEDSNK
eukprot:2801_1